MFTFKKSKNKKMNTKEIDDQDTLNQGHQNGGELLNNDAETEAEREDKEADQVMGDTDGVINIMKKVQEELATMTDKFLRLNAEFDNYKRRTTKERIDLIKTANADVITALLPVLDDFERAIKSLQKEQSNPALEGVSLIHHKIKALLEHKGLKAMDSIGKPFDVELHDAITQVPAPSKDKSNTVMDEVERGYFLNDKVIRHAKVVVYN